MAQHRVIQWTTGNVGRRSLRAIIRNPELDLVGVYAFGDEKVGRDAADLCGHPDKTGVLATNDMEALLALRPDAVSYNPLWPDIDMLCRLLEAGINVSSTAAFITGHSWGDDAVDRLRAAAERGNATMFGSGVNPGFVNLFALVSTQLCNRVDRIRVLESVDSSAYESKDQQESAGFAHQIDEPGLVDLTRKGTVVFSDCVAMMADALGVELDEIAFEAEYAPATQDMDFGFMTIPKGSVAAIDGRWLGRAYGRDVIVLECQWKMGTHVEAPFEVKHGYSVEITGEPSVFSQFMIAPPRDWAEPGYFGLGMIMTAMPAVNAIPAVIAAPPGIATHATLPLVAARGFVSQ